jgi:hypothetical protein
MAKQFYTSVLFFFCMNICLSAQDSAVKSIMTKKFNPATNLVIWPEEFHPDNANFYVYNEIEINAKPEVVWNILINAGEWHTYYKGVQSPSVVMNSDYHILKDGAVFKMHTMGLHLQPTIKEFVPNQRMAWEVRRSNLSGYHAWVIVPTETGCRLITAEGQNGFLTFLQKVFQPKKLLKLHDVWLKAMKVRAESLATK